MNRLIEPDVQHAIVSKLTRRLLPFLFLLYIVNYLDRINVGFAALEMQQQLGFNDAVYGLGAGMFFAGYFFFQVPSNLVLARLGARRWIAVIMILWGVISASMIFVSTARSFYGLRFLLGAAEAGFFPGMILYLKNWFPALARGQAVALFMTAGPLAGVIGGPISGALLGVHTARLAGWQWLFLIEGLPAVVLGGLVLAFVSDRPQDASWLNEEERNWLAQTLQQEKQLAPDANKKDVLAAFSNSKIWLLTLVYFGVTTCTYGLSLWLPNLIRSVSGTSNFVIGLLSTIPYIATAIAMVLAGQHSDRTRERRWHLAGSAFVGTIGLWSAAYATSTAPEIAALSLALLAAYSTMGPFWATAAGLLGETSAAAGIALINSFGNLGGFLGPSMLGFVRTMTGGFRGGLLFTGAMLILSGGVALAALRSEAHPEITS
jgi:MFS transporter, ACS family, tartrate transporter